MNSKIDRAIERSSLGTKKAQAARLAVPRATATRIVAASDSTKTRSKNLGGKRA